MNPISLNFSRYELSCSLSEKSGTTKLQHSQELWWFHELWPMSCITYSYTIIALFQPSQAKEQKVTGEILRIRSFVVHVAHTTRWGKLPRRMPSSRRRGLPGSGIYLHFPRHFDIKRSRGRKQDFSRTHRTRFLPSEPSEDQDPCRPLLGRGKDGLEGVRDNWYGCARYFKAFWGRICTAVE